MVVSGGCGPVALIAGWNFGKAQMHRPALAEFAGKPILHVGAQCVEVDAKTDLDPTFAGGQDIIEAGASGEASHGEAVKPCQRARPRRDGIENVHLESSGKH